MEESHKNLLKQKEELLIENKRSKIVLKDTIDSLNAMKKHVRM